jgi:hypothetical protein
MFVGLDDHLKKVRFDVEAWYHVKARAVLGDDVGDDKEISILNRKLVWCRDELKYLADPKHAKIICEELGLTSESNVVTSPAIKEASPADEQEDEVLDAAEARRFRSLAARANNLSMDRVDVQFAAKEVCKDMAPPKQSSWLKLKRLGRYLLECPVLEWSFRRQASRSPPIIEVYPDSDWAGSRRTRRSISGGIATTSGSVVKTWSGTQASVATSSGEAEYYALTRAAA